MYSKLLFYLYINLIFMFRKTDVMTYYSGLSIGRSSYNWFCVV